MQIVVLIIIEDESDNYLSGIKTKIQSLNG